MEISRSKKKILFAASEAHPFAATGGLGDVIGSLPTALAALDGKRLDVRVVIPLYGSILPEYREKMQKLCEFYMPLAWRSLYCGVWSLEKDGVIYYFIDNEYYFKRDSLYGCYDDGERFAYFSRAVLEMLPHIDFIPDILHAHDWQTALTAVYLRAQFPYADTRCIYTIHNIEYQGIYGFDILGDVFALSENERKIVEYRDCINLTKGAIVCADRVTTVSPRYAREIRDDRFSFGLASAVQLYGDKFAGIVNGIDVKLYNPVRDRSIPAPFSRSNMTGKAVCKAALQRQLGLPEAPDTPLFVMISRLAAHKGFDLVEQVMERFLGERDVQLAVLGTGERRYEQYFLRLAEQYPEKAAVRLCYNRDLAKQMYAGGDLFLMPSRSEPCGLAQMMASRYGSVPVVRATGGLADTIIPFDPTTGEGNGVTFLSYDPYDMLDALHRAAGLYDEKKLFAKLQRNAMSMDFSWRASAEKYAAIYDTLG